MNTVIATVDQVAADAYGCQLIGRTAEEMPYLKMGHERGLGTMHWREPPASPRCRVCRPRPRPSCSPRGPPARADAENRRLRGKPAPPADAPAAGERPGFDVSARLPTPPPSPRRRQGRGDGHPRRRSLPSRSRREEPSIPRSRACLRQFKARRQNTGSGMPRRAPSSVSSSGCSTRFRRAAWVSSSTGCAGASFQGVLHLGGDARPSVHAGGRLPLGRPLRAGAIDVAVDAPSVAASCWSVGLSGPDRRRPGLLRIESLGTLHRRGDDHRGRSPGRNSTP